MDLLLFYPDGDPDMDIRFSISLNFVKTLSPSAVRT